MITAIIEQTLILLPLIIGAYVTLSLLKVPDFSIESAYLCGAVAAYLAKDLPLPLVLLSAMGGGVVVGLTIGFLNQTLKIPYLLAAIITNGLFHGLTQHLLYTSVASFHLHTSINELSLLLITTALIVPITILLLRSQLGYCFAIFGNNTRFFSHHGISEKFIAFSGLSLAYALAGTSGFLFALSNGFVDLTMNFGIILLCLTALMIGKLAFNTPKPNILVPLIGTIALFILQQSLLRLGLNLKFFNAIQAIFILAFIILGQRKKKLSLDHLGV